MEPTTASTTPTVNANIISTSEGIKSLNLHLSRLPPNSLSQKKRRLATTRGLNKCDYQLVTPDSSPFRPSLGSTPVPEQLDYASSYLTNKASDVKFNAERAPVIRRPLTSIKTSVISPRLPVQEASLDWDNYSEIPSFKNFGDQQGILQFSNLDGIAGLEDNNKITLVETSVSSLSSDNSIPNMYPNETAQQVKFSEQAQLTVLHNMSKGIEDMMEDFTQEDVRSGNLVEVPRILSDISKARSEFRNNVREYKQAFNLPASTIENLDQSVIALNHAVKTHAHSIWAKVEVLQGEPVSSHAGGSSHSTSQPVRDDTEYKRNLFRDQLLYLTEALSLPDDDESVADQWKGKSESDIAKAMHELSGWQKSVEKLSRQFREYERSIQLAGRESESTFCSDSEDFENIRNKVKEVSLAVKDEDKKRNLQSLLPSKVDKVKYPCFSGDPGEDFMRFREKMLECFRKNRVPYSDMIDKLRECLKSAALKRVPETLKNIDTAWENLQEAFGSPMVVLKERLKSLTKLGGIPPDSSASKQIVWYHDIESVIQDIIDLGSSADLNLQMGAFGPGVQEQILRAFSDNPLKKREVAKTGHGKQPKQKIIAFRDKIIDFRRETQIAEVESGSINERDKKQLRPQNPTAAAHMTGSDPISNGDCRVCKQIESQGNPQRLDLFVNHLGHHTYQCPVFMKLVMKERVQVIRKIQLCQYCLDYKVITDRNHEATCKSKKSNTSHLWKCDSTSCGRHSWVCLTHADNSNKSKLKKYAEKFSRRGLQFATAGILSLSSTFGDKSAAYRSLEKQVDRELVPTPDGQPMFLFYCAKGKTRALKIFFDSGCSRFIMRDCIPNVELPASLVKKGRFPIGGVGGCTIYAENEYMVAMDTIDGKAQQLQGVTVQSITSDFPELDISAAVSEVIANAPQNLQLRRCKFPRSVGGRIDCLIGIQYNQLQPVMLHMLPSGLAIYKTKLAPHIPGQKYVIGGSHASFDAILSQVGNTDHLMEHFIAGLANWKQLGPPKLTQFVMSESEVTVAMERNLKDEGLREFRKLIETEHQEYFEKDFIMDDRSCSPQELCANCGSIIAEDYFTTHLQEDERLSRLKHLLDSQDSGVDITYRCIRCRNCSDCQNAEKVDRISLREETELYEIKNSYFLDWERGVISCTLPLRGRERDFLSSNEERAMKVLDSQCRKYSSDIETKQAIIQSFKKLIEKGYIVYIEDLPDELKEQFINKEVQYYLPWRVQFKLGSASTPIRPVFDASSGTKKRRDNSGGKCLNDLVCKGPIDTLDLLKVVLRFFIGPIAFAADLTKMYNQFKLVPNMWNLQRILLKDNLDINEPVRHAIVNTLIYGVKSVAGQTEHALEDIGNYIQEEKPNVAKLLKYGRYVDNLLESTTSIEAAKEIASQTEEVLGRLNLETKGYSFSGEPPESKESTDGISIDVNAMKWYTETDLIEVKVPSLHFGNVCRGRVATDKFFEVGGDMAKMEAFVPAALTRRMIVSKRASLYDAMGKLEPIKAKLKVDERQAVQLTRDWDDAVPSETRNKWLRNFLLIEELRGIRFTRARMPKTALNTKMRLITLVDAAESIVMISTYCGFRLQDGGWSNQHLISRSALGTETIPRNELQALNGGSNLAWIVRKSLPDWVETSILAGDSEIALKWTTFDSRKLGMWVRNRIIQIRRGTDFDNLYYVGTDFNAADIGTRPERVSLKDIGPDSRFENGDSWMRLDINEAIQQGYVRPALDMKNLSEDKETAFKKEFILDKEPEILTRGHIADEDIHTTSHGRTDKIAKRAAVCNYDKLLPTRRAFPVMVRIASYVIAFLEKCKDKVNLHRAEPIKWTGQLLSSAEIRFTMFPTVALPQNLDDYSMGVSVITNDQAQAVTGHQLYINFSTGLMGNHLERYTLIHSSIQAEDLLLLPSDRYLNLALLYYFRQAAREVIAFNGKQLIERRTILRDGVLLSRGRILDGMNFQETADLDTLNLGSLGIKTMIPVVDRFSPLAYSLAQHFHWSVAKHRGQETCLRMSLEHVSILQGMSLFREISDECFKCKMKRGKYVQASQGPLSEKQLLIAPPFYATQIDLFGPLRAYVPGYEKETRATKVKESKIWVFVAVCIVTGNINLQVCEMRDTSSMLEAFIRLGCECGYPKYVCCDKESSILPVMKNIDVNLRDLSHKLYTEQGVVFETCPLGGHEAHGKVERTIKSVQESLEDIGFSKMRLPAMGIQTLCKQIENSYNNLPLGYRYDRSQDNTKVLKMIVPNMLKTGRINSRALEGPVRLSSDVGTMIREVQSKFEAWYKVWSEVYVPKLLVQKSGFKNSRDLQVHDIVYFQKKQSELTSPWSVGKIDQIIRGRDGVIRKVVVKYRNSNEDFDRVTDRSSRKLVKLYSVDDPDLHADLSKLQDRIDKLTGACQEGAVADSMEEASIGEVGSSLVCQCCCQSHCKVAVHNLYGSRTYVDGVIDPELFEIQAIFTDDWNDLVFEEDGEVTCEEDSLTSAIFSIGRRFE